MFAPPQRSTYPPPSSPEYGNRKYIAENNWFGTMLRGFFSVAECPTTVAFVSDGGKEWSCQLHTCDGNSDRAYQFATFSVESVRSNTQCRNDACVLRTLGGLNQIEGVSRYKLSLGDCLFSATVCIDRRFTGHALFPVLHLAESLPLWGRLHGVMLSVCTCTSCIISHRW